MSSDQTKFVPILLQKKFSYHLNYEKDFDYKTVKYLIEILLIDWCIEKRHDKLLDKIPVMSSLMFSRPHQ